MPRKKRLPTGPAVPKGSFPSLTRSVVAVGTAGVPALFAGAGPSAGRRFIEFFTANIRNPNTRAAYARAVAHFSRWCDRRRFSLPQLNPVLIAAYIEDLGQVVAKPTVKQHLAAIRMLFDYLVIGHIVPTNPATSVRGPKYVIKKGKTPVLTVDEARTLLGQLDTTRIAEKADRLRLARSEEETHSGHLALQEAIHQTRIADLRDLAVIAVMTYSFARVSAVIGMNVEDYLKGHRRTFRLQEKGGKHHEVPAHRKAEAYVDAYLAKAEIAGQKSTALFRSLDRHRRLSDRRVHRYEVLAMIKRRARRADLPDTICCHTFRATGITAYLQSGGTVEKAAHIAAHESTRTTQLYNRTGDAISLDEIDRIGI